MKGTNAVIATNKVALANLPLQTLWRQVDVEIQQQLISSPGTSYPYKAYLDVLLNYGSNAKSSQFHSQLLYRDISESMDETVSETGSNTGLAIRWQYRKTGGVVASEGLLYVDICQQNRFLLNGLQINFRLWSHW